MNPLTGQILTAAGAANTQAAIGTPIPGVGNLLNGIVQAGHGIADTNYLWPALVVAPRFGFAYDLTGKSDWVLRGGVGLFYDRPDGNTVFSTPGNPPSATDADLLNGQLATLGQGLSPQPVASLVTFQYNAQIPSSLQWNVGVQKSLPGQMVADVCMWATTGITSWGRSRAATFRTRTPWISARPICRSTRTRRSARARLCAGHAQQFGGESPPANRMEVKA